MSAGKEQKQQGFQVKINFSDAIQGLFQHKDCLFPGMGISL